MKRKSGALLAAVLVVLVGACGGSEPEARQRNTVLCFETVEERDTAIAEAQAQLEALLAPAGGDIEGPAEEAPAEDEAPAEIEAPAEEGDGQGDDVVGTDSEDASGGRGKFVTAARRSIDENMILAALRAENDAEESEEVKQARANLEEIGARPLCNEVGGDEGDGTEPVARTVRESRECVVTADFADGWATVNVCQEATSINIRVLGTGYGYGAPRGGSMSFYMHDMTAFNIRVSLNDETIFDADFEAGGESSRIATYEVEVENQIVNDEEGANDDEVVDEEMPQDLMDMEPACEDAAITTFEPTGAAGNRVGVTVTTSSPADCDDFVVAAVLDGAYTSFEEINQAFNRFGDRILMCVDGAERQVVVACTGLRSGDTYTIAGFSMSDAIRETGNFQVWVATSAEEQCDANGITLERLDEGTFRINGCDNAERFRVRGLTSRTIRTDSPTFALAEVGDRPVLSGPLDVQIKAYFQGPPVYADVEVCYSACEATAAVTFVPANPTVGDGVWFSVTDSCIPAQWYWKAYRADGVLHSGHPTHQPFVPSQGEAYRLVLSGTCEDGTELFGETTVNVTAAPAPRHDDFNDPLVLETPSGTVSLNSTGSTLQAGEPKHSGCEWEGDNSVWFSYTAAADGILQHDYLPGTFGVPTLTMYRGDAIGALERKNSWFTGDWVLNTAVFAGETYRFVIVGCYRSGFGEINLRWNFIPNEEDVEEPADGREQLLEAANPQGGGEPVQTREVVPTDVDVTEGGVQLNLPITIDAVTFTAETVDELLEKLNAPGSDAWIVYDGALVPLSGSEQVNVRLTSGRTEIVLRDVDGSERRVPVQIAGAPKVGSAAVTVVSSSAANAASDSGSGALPYIIGSIIALLVLGGAGLQIRRRRV
jgi:hypothetical protein